MIQQLLFLVADSAGLNPNPASRGKGQTSGEVSLRVRDKGPDDEEVLVPVVFYTWLSYRSTIKVHFCPWGGAGQHLSHLVHGLSSWRQELSRSLSSPWLKMSLSEFSRQHDYRLEDLLLFFCPQPASKCVWRSQTLAPFDPGSAFNLRGGMRGIHRPEEAEVGGGSSDADGGCHPASRRLANFTFSRNGVRRRMRAVLVLREVVSLWF